MYVSHKAEAAMMVACFQVIHDTANMEASSGGVWRVGGSALIQEPPCCFPIMHLVSDGGQLAEDSTPSSAWEEAQQTDGGSEVESEQPQEEHHLPPLSTGDVLVS